MKFSRKLSNYFVPTLKEDPKEAEIPSHRLMIRSGMIRKLASGIYEFLPIGWRVVRKVEKIIREEMDRINGQEMVMSALQPKDLWDQTGRWDLYGPELMRLTDRNDREFCLGPTHEEVITHLVKTNIKSYKDLPLLLYQFQMKFRDEIRPRFGVMRAREFYMKDAYSFDTTVEACQKSYDNNYQAYKRIFKRCGLDFVAVEADTGNIGGKSSHEFMVIADTGEEEIAVCTCGYGANSELAAYQRQDDKIDIPDSGQLELNEVHTPDVRTVEEVSGFLSEKPGKFIKTLVYNTERGPVVALVRGDHELNEALLKKAAGTDNIELADGNMIMKLTGGPLGFSGPVGLKSVDIYADMAVLGILNAVSGANKDGYHLKNINYGRDYKAKTADLRRVMKGDKCPKCSKELEFRRGIEVGHTFFLGTKYSKSMEANFTSADSTEQDIIMGCYGIGVTRVVAAAIEQSHDENGIIWPAAIAPFQVEIIQLSEEVKDVCASLYNSLSMEYEVLWDDRDDRPGAKFKDADLMGIPIRIVVGKNYLNEGNVEVQYRKTGEKKYVKPDSLGEILRK
ncbi:MAG: proline--tRNA ligase [Elusimicrobiota bacterium]